MAHQHAVGLKAMQLLQRSYADGMPRGEVGEVEPVRAISAVRLVERLGRLGSQDRHTVDEILKNVLHLD